MNRRIAFVILEPGCVSPLLLIDTPAILNGPSIAGFETLSRVIIPEGARVLATWLLED